MKLGPVTKLEKLNETASKKFDDDFVGDNNIIQKYTRIFKFGLQFYVQTRPKKRKNHFFEIFKTLKARDQFNSDRCLTGFRYTYPHRVLLLPFEQLIVTA